MIERTWIPLMAAIVLLVSIPDKGEAQVAVVGNGTVSLSPGGGLSTAYLSDDGELVLGHNGKSGKITIFQADGSLSAKLDSGSLLLGSVATPGSVFGYVALADSDGTGAVTVLLDGETGKIDLGMLGTSPANTEDGELYVHDTDGALSIALDGATGNVTNQLDGNGLVKAWARINSDGSIASCWNCNPDTAETRQLAVPATYEVDFTIGWDITSRPRICSLGHGGVTAAAATSVICVTRVGVTPDPSSIYVETKNASGALTQSAFTIVVY